MIRRNVALLCLASLLPVPAWTAERPLPSPYEQIETATYRRAVDLLASPNAALRDAQIREVEGQSAFYAPPALLALATALWGRGERERALFWFNAGRLRALFDLRRCTDNSVSGVLLELLAQVPPTLLQWQQQDSPALQAVLERAANWDRSTPYRYDHRWINLFGTEAFRASVGQGSGQPLTFPTTEWAGIAELNRREFLSRVGSPARATVGGEIPPNAASTGAAAGESSAPRRPRPRSRTTEDLRRCLTRFTDPVDIARCTEEPR